MKLGDAAAVRSGLVLSRRQSRTPTAYRYQLLNLRSVNPGGYIDLDNADLYDAIEALSPDYLSHEGDVIVRLSSPYTAVLIDKSTAGLVVSSNFVIIRSNPKQLLPEYLYWLLNTAKVKRQIFENTSSNMLGAIKPRYFKEFEIIQLPLEEQDKIAKLNLLAHKEYQLLNKLADEKEKYYALTIDKIQQQMRRGISYDNKK